MNPIIQCLKNCGYPAPDARFYDHIELWKSWYAGKVRSFHC